MKQRWFEDFQDVEDASFLPNVVDKYQMTDRVDYHSLDKCLNLEYDEFDMNSSDKF